MKKSTFKFLAIAVFFLMGAGVMAQSQYAITFQVDMTGVTTFNPAMDTIWMSGNFAGWDEPGSNDNYKMAPTEEGSMIYTLTATIDSGEVQYKYFASKADTISWANGEWDGDPNRKIYITEDATISNVWANKPMDITFVVDMTDADPFDPATDEVYIGGDLANGWATPGSLSPYMLTPTEDGSMFYTVTLPLYPGSHMYKYFRIVNGEASWSGGEWEGDPNREVTTDTVAATFNNVWGDINAGIFNQPNVFTYTVYPNPVTTVLNISNTADISAVNIYDITGKLVRSVNVEFSQNVTINVEDLQTGVYAISVTNDKGVQTSKFLKN